MLDKLINVLITSLLPVLLPVDLIWYVTVLTLGLLALGCRRYVLAAETVPVEMPCSTITERVLQ